MQEEKINRILSKVIIILIMISLVLIGLNGYRAYKRRVRWSTYKIILKGDNPLKVYQDDIYIEPGYTAYNYKNQKKDDLVKIKNNVDTSTLGKYQVEYKISNIYKKLK